MITQNKNREDMDFPRFYAKGERYSTLACVPIGTFLVQVGFNSGMARPGFIRDKRAPAINYLGDECG